MTTIPTRTARVRIAARKAFMARRAELLRWDDYARIWVARLHGGQARRQPHRATVHLCNRAPAKRSTPCENSSHSSPFSPFPSSPPMSRSSTPRPSADCARDRSAPPRWADALPRSTAPPSRRRRSMSARRAAACGSRPTTAPRSSRSSKSTRSRSARSPSTNRTHRPSGPAARSPQRGRHPAPTRLRRHDGRRGRRKPGVTPASKELRHRTALVS